MLHTLRWGTLDPLKGIIIIRISSCDLLGSGALPGQPGCRLQSAEKRGPLTLHLETRLFGVLWRSKKIRILGLLLLVDLRTKSVGSLGKSTGSTWTPRVITLNDGPKPLKRAQRPLFYILSGSRCLKRRYASRAAWRCPHPLQELSYPAPPYRGLI